MIGVDDVVTRVTERGRSDMPGESNGPLVSIDTAVRPRIDTPCMESGTVAPVPQPASRIRGSAGR